MNNHIPELELNFSNICGANCFICSPVHGSGNDFFMSEKTFDILLGQLKDCNVGIFQTSGNGECLLNPNYHLFLRKLKHAFPNTPRWCYNNFSMMDYDKAQPIINEKLIDKMHVRIESLDREIFEKCSRLNQCNVFKNLTQFMNMNEEGNVELIIIYHHPGTYYDKCIKIIGKPPQYWPFRNRINFPHEMEDIKNYFQKYSHQPINIFEMGHSLWAEREHALYDSSAPCPKLGVMKKAMWISPSGSVEGCCYCDEQADDAFRIGNIYENHILDIWNGEKRKELINKVENRLIVDYPCVNPKCCEMSNNN
jgi:hypothetical protein